MRNAFASEITKIATENPKVVLLAGDIGNRLFNDYKDSNPGRFFNCGVAEANMTGMAAGLAMSGLRPVTYTIAPFATTRCLEQIKIDVCYQNLPVVIVGVGAGLSYAGLGATHHSLEDISFLRTIPNMTVICPADVPEVRLALRAALQHNGPVYLRLGKKNEPIVHQSLVDFEIGKGIVVRPGSDVCLLSTGNTLPLSIQVADALEKQQISVQVVSFHTVKPLDEELLENAFEQYQLVATVEEHSLLGGLGSAISEWVIDRRAGHSEKLLRFGTQDHFLHEAGSQDFARGVMGLSCDEIANRIRAVC